MIAEIGHFALIIALGVALVQTILPLAGAARGLPSWMAVARPAAFVQRPYTHAAIATTTRPRTIRSSALSSS
ncbi:MAG: hypothetical protein ACLGGU_07065, partial [Gammaproteobacteria bacterium]